MIMFVLFAALEKTNSQLNKKDKNYPELRVVFLVI